MRLNLTQREQAEWEALEGCKMRRNQTCQNCANGKHIGSVMKCEVRGIIRTEPYTACPNYERAKRQVTLEDVE